LSNYRETNSFEHTEAPAMSEQVDIDTATLACAWLMVQFPGLSRRVVADVLDAYRERTTTLDDACDAARARLTDACDVA
jgi:hypothetical protein